MRTNRQDHSFLVSFIRLFLPLALLFGLVIFLGYWYSTKTALTIIKEQEKSTVRVYAEHLHWDVSSVLSDLEFLTTQSDLKAYLSGNLSKAAELEKTYLSLSKAKGIYDQVRFLDHTGMERIRVNYNNGNPVIVPQAKLQNKAGRYYFDDSFSLKRGEIFVSPLDLNMENGEIERPLKPMLRFGAPVFDINSNKQGIVLLNYLASSMLNSIEHLAPQALGNAMLLNADGYWLRAKHIADEWGFMYPDKKQLRFQERFPAEWKVITAIERGQILTDNGLVTFSIVKPMARSRHPATNHEKYYPPSTNVRDSEQYHWRAVSLVTPKVLAEQSKTERVTLTSIFVAILVVLAVFSALTVRSRVARNEAEVALQDKNEVLSSEVNRRKRTASEEQALSTLLFLALEPTNLKEFLRQSIDALLNSVNWINLLPRGGIFLTEEKGAGQVLEMVANHNLDPRLDTLCSHVPYGTCLCGRAAASGEVQFADCVDERHEISFDGMPSHGHYNIPITYEDNVIGVVVIYLPHGYKRSEDDIAFLERSADVLSLGIIRRYAAEFLEVEKNRVEEAYEQLRLSQESLNRFKTTLDQTIDCIFMFDPETLKFFYLNQGAINQVGYSREELMEMTPLDIKPEYTEDSFREMIAPMLNGSEISATFETVHRHKDGTIIPVDIFLQYVAPTGEQPRFVAIVRDIAEKKTQEAQLRHLQKMESIGQLAAGIAHEINTPAQYVADNTRFLKESFDELEGVVDIYGRLLEAARNGEALDELIAEVDSAVEKADLGYIAEETPKAVEEALDGLQKIAIIVSAMKEFSHPGTENKEPVDINSLIENIILVSRNEWKYVADIEKDLDATLPLVPGIRDKLSQAFLNLIVNAAHAIEEQEKIESSEMGVIRVSTREVGENIEVRISDTGPGVPEAIQKRIFDPFFTTKDVGKGTGQGLAIAYSAIVDKHKGSLTLEQKEGGGATFIISLPKN